VDLAEFLNTFIEFMRHLLMLKIGVPLKGIVTDDLEVLKNITDTANLNNLMYMMSLLIQLKQDIKTSSHSSIMIEVVLLKMTRLDDMEDLDKILANLTKIPTGLSNAHVVEKKPTPQPVAKKVDLQESPKGETFELDYVPPKKVLELTKEHVLENWDAFINKIKSSKKMVSMYLKKECITSVKSDIIFMEFDSSLQYKMVSESKESLTELLSTFFGISNLGCRGINPFSNTGNSPDQSTGRIKVSRPVFTLFSSFGRTAKNTP